MLIQDNRYSIKKSTQKYLAYIRAEIMKVQKSVQAKMSINSSKNSRVTNLDFFHQVILTLYWLIRHSTYSEFSEVLPITYSQFSKSIGPLKMSKIGSSFLVRVPLYFFCALS